MLRLSPVAAFAAALLSPSRAFADAANTAVTSRATSRLEDAGPTAARSDVERDATYYRLFGGIALGRGLRFNNPYRLETQLGDTAESLSLTAPYVDVWAGAAFGPPDGLQHGGAVHAAMATEGVTQEVVTPSYVLLYQIDPRWILGLRGGFPIVMEPDANVGAELSTLATLLITATVGVSAELVASLFYGAATLDTSRSAIPIVSFQLGASIDYEVLP